MQGDVEDVVQLLLVPTNRFHLFISHGMTTGYFRYGNSGSKKVSSSCVYVLI